MDSSVFSQNRWQSIIAVDNVFSQVCALHAWMTVVFSLIFWFSSLNASATKSINPFHWNQNASFWAFPIYILFSRIEWCLSHQSVNDSHHLHVLMSAWFIYLAWVLHMLFVCVFYRLALVRPAAQRVSDDQSACDPITFDWNQFGLHSICIS